MTLQYFPIQILLIIMMFWPISRAYFRYKDGVIKLSGFLFWSCLWLMGVITVFYPEFLTYLAQLFHIGRGTDLAVYVALALAFYLVFRLSVIIENIRNDITRLTREIALMNKNRHGEHK